MNRPRVVAALSVIFAFLGTAALAHSLQPAVDEAAPAAVHPPTTTTSEPDFEAVVKSGFVDALADEEADLTDEAISRSTSTTATTSTTTTLAPSTTATTAASKSKSPPQSSPPKTSPPTTKAASQGGYSSSAESDFASRINSYRDGKGQSALSRSGSLNSYARSWAKKLAQSGALSHSNIGSLLGTWTAVGENVGSGGSVGSIFSALKSSSGHQSNMVGDFTHMGIGVWIDGNGVLWTAHVFAR